MDIRKSLLKPDNSSGHPDKSRRSFMWKAGAGLSALLAATIPGVARAGTNNDRKFKNRIGSLSAQIGILKDENNIRLLYRTYEDFLNRGRYEDVVNLFTDDSSVVFNGGLFKGRSHGINRLYCRLFRSGLTGKRIEYVQGVLPDMEPLHESIEVRQDRKTARAWFPYSIQVGSPIASNLALVNMAHLHGEGIIKWWEGGTCDITCVKDLKEGTWKIEKLEYLTLSKANYRPGRSSAGPISVFKFTKLYPEDPSGPDRLVEKQ